MLAENDAIEATSAAIAIGQGPDRREQCLPADERVESKQIICQADDQALQNAMGNRSRIPWSQANA